MKGLSNSRGLLRGYGVVLLRSTKWFHVAVSGSFLLGLGGCLGPNPGFFVSSSVANATIFTLVNTFVSGVLGSGGG